MRHQRRIGPTFSAWLSSVIVCLLLAGSTNAQPPDAAAATNSTPAGTNLSQEISRLASAQLQVLAALQSQQIATLKELEQARKDIARSLAETGSNNAANLAAITELMTNQRKQDLKIVRDTFRTGLAIVVGLSGLLLVSILFLNLTSIRAINRMTTMFSASALLPGSEAQSVADQREAERQLLLFPGEQGQRQLGNALVQLHSRIEDLERLTTKFYTSLPPKAAPQTPAATDSPTAAAGNIRPAPAGQA
ncbi:MAG: hypothetical protein EXS35_08805 [Pedosphaera sp.]|nr:hypothetical protein [Pedosphaera sp.]